MDGKADECRDDYDDLTTYNQQNKLEGVTCRTASTADKNRTKRCCIAIGILVAVIALIAVLALVLAVVALAKVAKPQNCPGSTAITAASSCQQILNCNHFAGSGNYWIASKDGPIMQRYCDMNRVCGGVRGGWMRIAKLDMRNSSSQCPRGLRERVHPGKRLCGRNLDATSAGCSQVFFETNRVKYDKVCGKIIAYQLGSTDSFGLNFRPVSSIDEVYLDGVSLTYSSSPRKHIWSFAAALDEVGTSKPQNCPCTNINFTASATYPPFFVGNDYFCDTASAGPYTSGYFYADDPLWDGAGCGPYNTCCLLNTPPWFFKHLGLITNDNIEMRVCSNEHDGNEDVLIEQIEIYVQ